MEVKRLSPQAYEMHQFMIERCNGEINAMSADTLCFWLGLTTKSGASDTRTLRRLRAEINGENSEIQRKVLTSNNGYYIALAFDTEHARKQYEKVAWRKIKQGVKYIQEGKRLLEHAELDGQLRLQLTEYMKPIVEIATKKED